jgi:DNA-binding MarR family transcriptional regulator
MHLGDAHYQLLAEIRHRIRRFLAFSERRARAAGLEPQQHQLLLAVRAGLGAAGIGDLARRLLLRHHSAVELVDRLERRGLVARRRDAADGRRVLVRLTPRGERVLARLSEHHLAELRTSGPELARALARLLATRRPRRRR